MAASSPHKTHNCHPTMRRRQTVSRRQTISAPFGRLAQTFGRFVPRFLKPEDRDAWDRLESIHRIANDLKEVELRLGQNNPRATTQAIAIETQITALSLGASFHPKFVDGQLAELAERMTEIRDLMRDSCGLNKLEPLCSHLHPEPILENPLEYGVSSVVSSRSVLSYLASHQVAAIPGTSEAEIVRRAYSGVHDRLRVFLKQTYTFEDFQRL